MRRLPLLLLSLILACETTEDRVNKDDPAGEVTIKPDEIEPMANFVLETRRLLVAENVKIECSSQFFEQQMGYTRDPAYVQRSKVEIQADGSRLVRLQAVHGQETNVDPDILPRVYFGNSGLEIRAYKEIHIYLRPPKDRDRPLFLSVDARNKYGDAQLYVSGRLQQEKPRIVIKSELLWSEEKERYIHKSAVD